MNHQKDEREADVEDTPETKKPRDSSGSTISHDEARDISDQDDLPA